MKSQIKVNDDELVFALETLPKSDDEIQLKPAMFCLENAFSVADWMDRWM